MRRLSTFTDIDEAEAALLAGAVEMDLPLVLEGGLLDFGLATCDHERDTPLLHLGIIWLVQGAPLRGQRIYARAAAPAHGLALLFWQGRRAAGEADPTC